MVLSFDDGYKLYAANNPFYIYRNVSSSGYYENPELPLSVLLYEQQVVFQDDGINERSYVYTGVHVENYFYKTDSANNIIPGKLVLYRNISLSNCAASTRLQLDDTCQPTDKLEIKCSDICVYLETHVDTTIHLRDATRSFENGGSKITVLAVL